MLRSIAMPLVLLSALCLVQGCSEDEDTRDFDNDGLLNADEYREGSDDRNPDTDGDGLTDGEEVHVHGTDPTLSDTDGDGVDDKTELLNGTDPLVADPPEDGDQDAPLPDNDPDNDGLTTDSENDIYSTDPLDADSDGDGRTDYAEVKLSVWANGSYVGKTDPNDPDSDNDGTNDGTDNCPLTSNPAQTDTDSDGYGDACDLDDDNDQMPDAWEIDNGLDPMNPVDPPLDPDFDGISNIDEYNHRLQRWSLSFRDFYLERDSLRVSIDDIDGDGQADDGSDSDGDGIPDNLDVCPSVPDPDQTNTDGDAYGDACDADDDGDGIADQWEIDNGLDPLDPSDAALNNDADAWTNLQEFDVRLTWQYRTTDPALDDTDGDSIRDDLDNCPATFNADQSDADSDGFGDVCDNDRDNDGMADWWEDQNGFDTTTDDSGADPDGDNLTNLEEYQLETNPLQADSDSDTVNDDVDNCPIDPNQDQLDQDADGEGDVCDSDRDGDGVSNHQEYIDGTNPDDQLGASIRLGYSLLDVGAFDYGREVVRQDDGKLVVAGYSETGLDADFFVARFMADGSPDPSFGAGGLVKTAISSGYDWGSSVIQQSDGKLVMVGDVDDGGDVYLALARYSTTGSLDSTFGAGGIVSYGEGAARHWAWSVIEQSDGKLVAVGGADGGPDDDVLLIRFNSDGSLDGSFGSGGVVTTDFASTYEYGRTVIQQPDNRLIVAGYRGGDFLLVRYNADGSLDTGFGASGVVTTDISGNVDEICSLLEQPDGKLVAAGRAWNGNNFDAALVRYDASGSLDASFGTGGVVTTSIESEIEERCSIVQQPDGKLVFTKTSWNGVDGDVAMARYNADGSLDASFGVAGLVTTDISDDFSYSVIRQPDGKLVVAGSSLNGLENDIMILRYLEDGSLDTTFGDSP